MPQSSPLLPPALTTDPTLPRARAAVCVLFALAGLTAGSWVSRAPDIKARNGLSDSGWGVVATCATLGTFLSMGLVAFLIARVGARRLGLVAGPAILLVAPLMALPTEPKVLAVGLFAFGFAMGSLQAPMNTQAVALERAYVRPIMSSFHACFSLGTLAGGLIGYVAARTGVAPATQLTLTGVLLAAALATTCRWLPADDAPAERAGDHESRRPWQVVTPQLALLAAIAFFAILAEGTTAQWSAIYVSDALGAGAAAGALAYACFALAMSSGRLAGDRIVQRVGRERFLRTAPLVAAAGMGVALAVGTEPAAILGFVVIGLGLSCLVPTIFGTAGNQPDVPASTGVSTITMASWPAFLLGPPLVGALSSMTSLRFALVVVIVAAGIVVLLAQRVRAPEPSQPEPAPAG